MERVLGYLHRPNSAVTYQSVSDITRTDSLRRKILPHPNEGILEIQVPEGLDKPYRCRDGFFIRTGPNAQKLNRDEIVYFINQTGKIRFDEAINDRFHYPNNFPKEAFSDYLKRCGITSKLPKEDILISLNVATEMNETVALTNAGILFFADKPHYFVPESFITGVRYSSFDRFSIIENKDFKGSLISQIEAAMEFLQRADFVGQVGSGFDRMRVALEQNNNPPLEVSATNFFSIRFNKRIVATSLSPLSSRQQKIIQIMQNQPSVTKKMVATALEVSEDTALRELKYLMMLAIIKKQGEGKQTQYVLMV
jgi:predicted HTH transcriptional regulator